jgi:DNA repair protein RecN (Recombination protein N)
VHLQQDRLEAKQAYDAAAEKLCRGRRKQLGALAARDNSSRMQTLALAGGSFSVRWRRSTVAAPRASNSRIPGRGACRRSGKAIGKVASGGELSRISLAIRVVTAQQGDIPTMIFDEVDVGIGGGVAEIVGQLLRRWASSGRCW